MPGAICEGLTIDEMIASTRDVGPRATRGGESGRPFGSSAGGNRVAVFLTRPSAARRCSNAQFYASPNDRTFAIGEAKGCNTHTRYAKALHDRDDYPAVDFGFFIKGLPAAYRKGVFNMWEILMARVMGSIGKSGGRTFVSASPRSVAGALHG